MLAKWSNEHMVKSYVDGIPLNGVLAHAGFQNNVHMNPRTTVEADQELLDFIFPGVERMHSQKKEVCGCTCYSTKLLHRNVAGHARAATACCLNLLHSFYVSLQ